MLTVDETKIPRLTAHLTPPANNDNPYLSLLTGVYSEATLKATRQRSVRLSGLPFLF